MLKTSRVLVATAGLGAAALFLLLPQRDSDVSSFGRQLHATAPSAAACAAEMEQIGNNEALKEANLNLLANFNRDDEGRCTTSTAGTTTCQDDFARTEGYDEFMDLCESEGFRAVSYNNDFSCVHILKGPYNHRMANDFTCIGVSCDAEAIVSAKDQQSIDFVCESDIIINTDYSNLKLRGGPSSNNSDIIHTSTTQKSSTADYIRSSLQEYQASGRSNDYPLHDAMIAAFLPALGENADRSVSLDDMEDVLRDCSTDDSKNQDLVSQIRSAIPSIISKAMKRFNFDTGRVLEVSDHRFELGDNYYSEMRSATLSCYVSTTDFSEDINAVAAFASYVVAPLESDTESPDPMAYAHNLSMFIEADVMETPSQLMYYIPKRYCLQDLDVDNGKYKATFGMSAILGNTDVYRSPEGEILGYAPQDRVKENVPVPDNAPFLDTTPNTFSATKHERSVALGPRQGVLPSRLNRLGRSIAWAHKIEDYKPGGDSDYEWGLVLDAFTTPKLELWAARLADIFGTNHFCLATFNFNEAISCLQDQIQDVLDDQGVGANASFGGTMAAVDAFGLLREWARDWRFHIETNNKEFSDEEIESWIAQGIATESSAAEVTRLMRRARYPVPYIFDRNIALWHKNSPLHPIEVNPYSEGSTVTYPTFEEESGRTQCMGLSGDSNSASASIAAARIFQSALLRRFEERKGHPLANTGDWKYHDYGPSAQKFPEESLDYERTVGFDDEGNLLPGNLTERTLGKTAKWLMVSPWYETERLQDLMNQAQTSNLVYSRVATAVYNNDNPCKDAATDTDIFVFVIAIALAGFGAVSGVLRHVHSCCHWWVICCWGKKTNVASNSQSQRYFLYEWSLILLGALVFVGLFAPLVVQTVTEIEIYNYQRESVSMQLYYSDWNANQNVMNSINQPATLTLVQAKSYCQDARPWTLLSILIVGIVISIVSNAPFLVRVSQALQRCFGVQSASRNLDGLTVHCEELKTLEPVRATDYDPSSGSLRDFKIANWSY